jgi:type IV pilus assembly protein PilA
MKYTKNKGFTLIEILLVIAIIAILAAIVIIAINPAKQLRDARNAQRSSNVNTILNAISQYTIDNSGSLPGSIPTGTCASLTTAEICKTGTAAATCTAGNLVDLSALTSSGTYIVSVPNDPQASVADDTGYRATKDANNRVTVCAPLAEGGATISVTR